MTGTVHVEVCTLLDFFQTIIRAFLVETKCDI